VKNWTVVANSGSVDTWTKRWTFSTDMSQEDLLKVIETKMGETWTAAPSRGGSGSQWTFKDEKGALWNATAKLASTEGKGWSLVLHLERSKT
jgi:hypothetical protein